MRSIRNKIEEFEEFLQSIDYPEVVCLSETWCDESEIIGLKLHCYQLCDYFSRKFNRGGGVAIFIKEQYSGRILTCKCEKTELSFEYALTEIKLNESTISVCCFYRAPSSDPKIFIDKCENLLDELLSKNHPMFIVGDFNFHFHEDRYDRNTRSFLNILSCYGFKKLINRATRIDSSGRGSIIDNIFTNIDCQNLRSDIVTFELSDHKMQIVSFPVTIKNNNIQNYKLRRFFNNQDNLHYFKCLLSSEKWQAIDNNQNFSNNFSYFYNAFLLYMDIAFPLQLCRNKPKNTNFKPWITNAIINEGILLRDIYRTAKLSNNRDIWDRYNILKTIHANKISAAKTSYFSNIMHNSTNAAKTAWQIIRNHTNTKSNVNFSTPMFKPNGELIDSSNLANEFNSYFIHSIKSITERLNPKPSYNQLTSNKNSMFLEPTSNTEILSYLQDISKKDSSGEDEIPYSLLVKVADSIVPILTVLVNQSFVEGLFPDTLKIAAIYPIHKKGDQTDISNFRGIALLSAFSKIFEKAFNTRLVRFINKHHIIKECQFGFQARRSTQDAIMALYRHILKNFENKNKLSCLLFDLTRAFETVKHDILLNKLCNYGIRGIPLDWIASYLKNRSQFVHIKNHSVSQKSFLGEVNEGVPQGSILGPVLFVIFINDIVSNDPNLFISLFADDTSFVVNATNYQSLSANTTEAYLQMKNFCDNNGLLLNDTKTEMILFSTKPLDVSLSVKPGNVRIKQKECVKFLGIQIDSRLTWKDQIMVLLKKLSTKCFVIWQLRNLVDIHTLKLYYFAYIHSLLSYCIVCWGNSCHINEVFLSQKKIVRTMTSKNRFDSCIEIFKDLKIMTVYSLYIYKCLLYVKNNPLIFNSRDDFITSSCHDLRPNCNLSIPAHRLSTTAKGADQMCIKLYNKLPAYMKQTVNNISFKKQIKQFFLENPFYCVKDYLDYKF